MVSGQVEVLKYLIRYFWLHYLLLVLLGICWVFPKYRVIPNISGDPIPRDKLDRVGSGIGKNNGLQADIRYIGYLLDLGREEYIWTAGQSWRQLGSRIWNWKVILPCISWTAAVVRSGYNCLFVYFVELPLKILLWQKNAFQTKLKSVEGSFFLLFRTTLYILWQTEYKCPFK